LGSTRRIAALIFDFDGLIVDSETPGFQAWSEVYEMHGCSLPFDKYSACIGTIGGFDLHAYLEEQTGRPFEKVMVDMERDFWMSANEAIDYGVVSRVIETYKELS